MGTSKSVLPWRPLLLLVFVALIVFLARFFEIGGKVDLLKDWIHELGPLGPLVFALIYIVAVVVAVPAAPMTVLAGVMFGSLIGIAVTSLASTVGAGLSFLIARYLARSAVERWLSGREKFERLDRMTEEHGAIIVALTRLVPIFPFNLLNYGFGLTGVRFTTFLLWSWVCMLPGTVLFVVGGDAVARGVAEGRVPWILVGSLALTLVLLGFLVQRARRRLKERT